VVKGAFQTGKRAEWLKDQVVVIVDDVMTTGATMREVATVLKTHEVRTCYAIALAHTERS
jgi:predicted amidophosphoribosyltransferase